MGPFFSHLARNQKREKCACLVTVDFFLSQIPPINLEKRPDLGMGDQDLVLCPTKMLNKLLKKRGISKERAKEIKAQRRTLKNRGYAANCR